MKKQRLTKGFVDKIPFNNTGKPLIFWDIELPSFGISIGLQTKTYIVQRDIKGKSKRVTIGKHPPFTPEVARSHAREKLIEMTKGIDPNEQKRLDKIKGISLEKLYKKYVKERGSDLRPSTLRNYSDFMKNQFASWMSKPINSITESMVVAKHREVKETSGDTAAFNSFKFLQTLFNYAETDDPDSKNPVKILKKKKLWSKKKGRTRIIDLPYMHDWYNAVLTLENDSSRDCILLILFTGMRKEEAMSLEWDRVDFKGKTFTVLETKNGDPLKLPLTSFTYELLQSRHKKRDYTCRWVFPGKSHQGRLTDLKRACQSISAKCDYKFSPHDLRRTFSTIGSMTVSYAILKRLLNHRTSDITEKYINPSVESLREASQKITDEMFRLIHSPSS